MLFPKKKRAKLAMLAENRLILLEKSTLSRKLFEKDCSANSVQIDRIIATGSVDMQVSMVESGFGMAVVPDFVCHNIEKRGLVKLSLPELSKRKLMMLSRNKSKAEQILLAHFHEKLDGN